MSEALEALARDKEILLMRSALGRLRLRRATYDLRESLRWRRAAVTLAAVPAVQRMVFGLGLSLVGLGRTTRLLMLAGRFILFAKLARSIIDYAVPARRR